MNSKNWGDILSGAAAHLSELSLRIKSGSGAAKQKTGECSRELNVMKTDDILDVSLCYGTIINDTLQSSVGCDSWDMLEIKSKSCNLYYQDYS